MAKYTTTKTVTVIGDDGYRCRRGGHCLGHHGRLEASMVAGASRDCHCLSLIGSLNAHGRGNVYEYDDLCFVEEPTSIPRDSELQEEHQGEWSSSERKEMTQLHVHPPLDHGVTPHQRSVGGDEPQARRHGSE